MNGFFSPNNLFFRSLSWAVDIVGISILWLFLSLPLVTLVPASAALYQTCALCVRRGESGAFSRFLRSFLGNLRQGCLLSLVVVPLGLLLLLGQNVMAACRRGGGGVRHRPLRRLHGGPLPSLWGGLLAPSPFGAV